MAAPLLSCQGISKRFGLRSVFEGLSMSVQEGDRMGMIGPNGAGKSTLLKVLAGLDDADEGTVARRRGLKLAYVPQVPEFNGAKTALDIVLETATGDDPQLQAEMTLSRVGFTDYAMKAGSMSGGWKKRLALARELAREPELLLLDEPTNHLDTDGIEWLEELLLSATFSCVVVTHDRYFLDAIATRVTEVDRAYAQGIFTVEGAYRDFLERKQEYLHAEAKRRESLEIQVRTELDWLRRQPKARTTKAKDRIDRAAALMADLSDAQSRARTSTAALEFSASERQTKRLAVFEKVGIERGGRTLFRDIDVVFTPGKRLGIVGPNGSGKSTLLQLLQGTLTPSSGTVTRADQLRVVVFDQHREQLDPAQTLKRALAPEGDSVVFQGRLIHHASWAKRFLFQPEQLEMQVGRLSGGEQARVLIARLMLEPADLLLLDEPTNDLDIPTLEVLEETLLDFPGAIGLVTHDRFLLDRVATQVVGLDGEGRSGVFADYGQYAGWRELIQKPAAAVAKPQEKPKQESAKKKLSYKEALEFELLEGRIEQAEAELQQLQDRLSAANAKGDAAAAQALYAALEPAQQAIDTLYERWAELEAKAG